MSMIIQSPIRTRESGIDQRKTGTGKSESTESTGREAKGGAETKSDVLTISAESIQLLQKENGEENTDKGLEEKQKNYQEEYLKKFYQEQAQATKEAGKGVADLAKIVEIARRIANGDKVPPKDEKKLMEYNPKLYQASKSAAMLNQNKKHKKYKSLFQEEEKRELQEKIRDLNRQESPTSIQGSTETVSGEGTAITAVGSQTETSISSDLD